jgi:hypothetical protein
MSRITKQIAQETAKKLVQKKRQSIYQLKNQLAFEIEKELEKQIKPDIKTCFKNNPGWFKKTQHVLISGNGWNYQRIYMKNMLPSLDSSRICFTPKKELASHLLFMYNNINEQEKKVEELEIDLTNTIFNLRTYKSVEENFTEAFVLLPKKTATNSSIQLNLSDIKNRLKD